MQYDGNGKLAEAIAELYGLSPKSQVQIAALIKQAKADLGITSKAKRMGNDVKLAIYRWHYKRLSPADNIQSAMQGEAAPDSPVQYVKQAEDGDPDLLASDTVQYVKQDDNQSIPDTVTQEALAIEGKPETQAHDTEQLMPVLDSEDEIDADDDFKQLHFGVSVLQGDKVKRTTVMMEAYLVKALQRKHGLIDNPEIRVWIEQAIKADARFDSHKPLTKQVKRVITESLV